MARYWTKKRIMATDWKIGHEPGGSYPYRVFDPETGKRMAMCMRRKDAEAVVGELVTFGFTEYGQ